MQFTITVNMDNAAFGETLAERRLELAKITGAACARVEDGERSGTLLDSNGNTVGEWAIGDKPTLGHLVAAIRIRIEENTTATNVFDARKAYNREAYEDVLAMLREMGADDA